MSTGNADSASPPADTTPQLSSPQDKSLAPPAAPEGGAPPIGAGGDVQNAQAPELGDGSESEYSSLREYMKDVLGPDSHATIERYKDDESLARGFFEATKMVGQRSEAAKFLENLRSAGVTPDDLEDLVQRKRGGVGPGDGPLQEPAQFDDLEPIHDLVAENDEGTLVLTAKGKADPKAREKIARWQARMSEAMRNPALHAKLLAPFIRQELQLDEFAGDVNDWKERESRREQNEFVEKYKKLLKAEDGEYTDLARRVDKILRSEGYLDPSAPWGSRAEIALKLALAEQKEAPSTPGMPESTRRAPPLRPGVKPKRLTPDEFREKYGDDNFFGLAFAEYFQPGKNQFKPPEDVGTLR